MESLVRQLQADAINSEIDVETLLRKAFIVARKLAIPEMENWIERELNGYRGDEEKEVPLYRVLTGRLQAHQWPNYWVPVHGLNPSALQALSVRRIAQPIREIEHVVADDDGELMMPVTAVIQDLLNKGSRDKTTFAQFYTKSQFHGILSIVRTKVLEWALQLEGKGVLGEGLAFSTAEQKLASTITLNVLGNANFVGAMTHSQIQQDSPNATQSLQIGFDKDAIAQILQLIQKIDLSALDSDSRQQVEADVATVHSQIKAPKPKWGIVQESLKSVRSIFESAAGSYIYEHAHEIVTAITSLLS